MDVFFPFFLPFFGSFIAFNPEWDDGKAKRPMHVSVVALWPYGQVMASCRPMANKL